MLWAQVTMPLDDQPGGLTFLDFGSVARDQRLRLHSQTRNVGAVQMISHVQQMAGVDFTLFQEMRKIDARTRRIGATFAAQCIKASSLRTPVEYCTT